MEQDFYSETYLSEFLGITRESAPRFSLWKPHDEFLGIVILETDRDGKQTWVARIHDHALFVAAVTYLESNGAPTFATVQEQNLYFEQLQKILQLGEEIVEARDKALQLTGYIGSAQRSP